MPIVLCAKARTPAIIARKTRAMISPYSIATAPLLSLPSFRNTRIAPHLPVEFPSSEGYASEVKRVLTRPSRLQKIPTITVVAAALVDGEGRVLLQQRPPGRAMAGLWEFPGGKVEAGELPEAALERELLEELGIGADAGAFRPACFASAPLGERHMLLLLYLCRAWEGEPQPLHATALRWLRPVEMEPAEMPPADRPLVEMLEKLL